MRTKTLLLTVALVAAGAASSMAQVYSQNAVGYINLSIPSGFSMISNQLKPGNANYSLASLIPTPPPGTVFYKFANVGGYSQSVFDDLDLAWTNPNMTVDLGGGGFILSPSAFTLTLVGDVPQGSLSTPTPLGFSVVSSQVPQAGQIQASLGFTPNPGDVVYRFSNISGYSQSVFDDLDLVWLPSEPSVSVGEAFFVLKAPGPSTAWTRAFSVN